MAFSEVYVDPSIAADSGTGTISDPFGDLEYAIEQTTFDTTNGTRVNIKAGTAEVLAAELGDALDNVVTTVAWAPSNSRPCIFQGYTAVAGDGGVCTISGGGSVPIFSDTGYQGVWFVDCDLQNVGANVVINLGAYCAVIRCSIECGSTGNSISLSTYSKCVDNYINGTNLAASAFAISAGTAAAIDRNYIDMSGCSNNAVAMNASGSKTTNNIVILGTSCLGIRITNSSLVMNNSIYCPTAGTGKGIYEASTIYYSEVMNNLVEGLSGAGGVGIEMDTNELPYSGGNAVYNCTTAYSFEDIALDYGDNETLSASPFNDAANGDFSPVDTGNVIEGALPQIIGGSLVP